MNQDTKFVNEYSKLQDEVTNMTKKLFEQPDYVFINISDQKKYYEHFECMVFLCSELSKKIIQTKKLYINLTDTNENQIRNSNRD